MPRYHRIFTPRCIEGQLLRANTMKFDAQTTTVTTLIDMPVARIDCATNHTRSESPLLSENARHPGVGICLARLDRALHICRAHDQWMTDTLCGPISFC